MTKVKSLSERLIIKDSKLARKNIKRYPGTAKQAKDALDKNFFISDLTISQAMSILSIYDTIMSDVSKIWDLFEDHED